MRERERRRKRKRIVEQSREPTPTTMHENESNCEEMRGFEAYSKQPVLSPTTEVATSAPTRAEYKGKRRAKIGESCNFELLNLLKNMKVEIRERDEHIREELRWRDNHLEDQIKKRENNLTSALQQRDN